jgi:hypothetical protein
MTKKLVFIVVTLTCINRTNAQSTDSTSNSKKEKFSAGVKYISNQSYVGRKDSLKLPVITPYINFETHFGLYAKATGYVNLSQGNTGFDGVGIETGYEFSKKNWNGNIAFVKNFISDNSNLIIAPVKESLEFYLEKENKIVTPSIGAEYLFSSEGNDFIAYAGLAKSITLVEKDTAALFAIIPAVDLNAGTQNFYTSFLKNYAKNAQRKKKASNQTTKSGSVTKTVEEENQSFSLLSASFELPLDFTKGKFEWKTTPALEVPFNLSTGTDGTEKAKPYFYISSELIYSF